MNAWKKVTLFVVWHLRPQGGTALMIHIWRAQLSQLSREKENRINRNCRHVRQHYTTIVSSVVKCQMSNVNNRRSILSPLKWHPGGGGWRVGSESDSNPINTHSLFPY